MDNETKIKLSFNNGVTGQKKLENYEKQLKSIYGYINGLKDNSSKAVLKNIDKSVKQLSKELDKTKQEVTDVSKTLKSAFSIKAIEGFAKGIFNLGKGMFQLSQKTSEYVENVNLLEVAYRNANETIEQSSKRIETYIDKMSEAYGLDESRLTRQFGIFKQLANAMQLPTETAENLSEIMVKMTNDIASLYNLPLDRASNALQSALAGQVRPIRSATGADITEKTLQNTVEALGLDRTISQLSYVEKRLVMVISLTKQLKASQGDYARTIESSANQIRVMHEQWDRLSRAVGNVFYPILEKILPWLNGILMALTEIFNLLASFLGFKMPEFDYSGLVGVSDLAQDIEDELGGAGDAVDELANKLKGLRSFDKLNVINTPSSSSAGVSASASGIGNIDPKIMDAFNDAFSDYNDMMGEVQMKAEKIRDNIMEWLGFTKEINPLTGEIGWKFDHITLGTALGALGLGGFIYSGVTKIYAMLTKLTGLKFPWLEKFGKLLFTVVGGVAGGEIISLMANWWSNNMPSLLQDPITKAYKDQDMFGMWGDIANNYKTWSNTTEGQRIIYRLTHPLEVFEGFYNEITGKVTGGTTHTGGTGMHGGRGGRLATEEELKNLPVLPSFEKENEIYMANYTNAVTNYFEKVKENLPNVAEFSNIISQMSESSNQASDGFENLLTKFADSHYQIVGEDLNQINVYLSTLKENAYTSSQAYYDAILKITLGLQEQGYVAEETAEKVIDSAYRKRLAEEGNTQQFIDAMSELEKQFRNNEITEEEYYKQAVKIYKQFKQAPSLLQTFKGKLDVFNSSIKITADSWDIVSHNLQTTKGYFDDTISSMNAQYDENLGYLIQLRDYYDESSEDYKVINQEIESLTKQYTDNLKDATDGYAMYLLTTLQAINESGERESETAKQYMDAINEELSKYGVDVDLSKGQENISKQIDEIQKNIESKHPKLTVEIDADDTNFKSKWNNLADLTNKHFGSGSSLFKMFGVEMPLLANGGLPSVGQLFVANEHGAELVGNIGGQSFVANQNQMMDLLDKKIGNAQSNQKQIFNIYLDAEHKIGTYTLDQLEDLAKTNGSAITIGG